MWAGPSTSWTLGPPGNRDQDREGSDTVWGGRGRPCLREGDSQRGPPPVQPTEQPACPLGTYRGPGAVTPGGRMFAKPAMCGRPYLVSGRGLGHQQPHHGIPSLGHLAVPRGHSEGHLPGGDPQLPGSEDRAVCPNFEVHAVGLILRPLGPQTAAELDCKRRERRVRTPPMRGRAAAAGVPFKAAGSGSLTTAGNRRLRPCADFWCRVSLFSRGCAEALEKGNKALAVMAQWLSDSLRTKGLLVRFPVGAQA